MNREWGLKSSSSRASRPSALYLEGRAVLKGQLHGEALPHHNAVGIHILQGRGRRGSRGVGTDSSLMSP